MTLLVGFLEVAGLAVVAVALVLALGWAGAWILAGLGMVVGAQVLERKAVVE